MNYYGPEAIRRAEESLLRLGIPERLLMENAGVRSADCILSEYPSSSSAVVLAGPGRNGGDGFVVARLLARGGWSVRVLCSCRVDSYVGICRENRDMALLVGVPVVSSQDMSDEEITQTLHSSRLVVDALLGIGSRGEPRGEVARLIGLTSSAQSIVSLDIPSGVDPLTGAISGRSVAAAMTLTVIAPKSGLALTPGRGAAGLVRMVDIGYPLPEGIEALFSRFTDEEARTALPCFERDINKRTRGGMAVVGGSSNYRGAPVLALRGFFRSGGGLGFLFSDEAVCSACSLLLPEAIHASGLSSWTDGELVAALDEWGPKVDTLVLGPGLGRSPRAGAIVTLLWHRWPKRLIVDGDGLYWLGLLEGLPRRRDALLTPHEGEAAHLLRLSAHEVRNNRLSCLRALAERWGVVLLKGPETLVGDGAKTAIVMEGDRTLAVPGSGDVLSGMIAAFSSAGQSLYSSACLGAYVHGSAGCLASKRIGPDGVLASEIADAVPEILRKLRSTGAGE